jgi:hypothetical protein
LSKIELVMNAEGPMRSTVRSPGSADDDRLGEKDIMMNNKDPPEVVGEGSVPELTPQSKPQISPEELAATVKDCEDEIDRRKRQVSQQQANDDIGKETIGVYQASKINQVLEEQWREVRRDRSCIRRLRPNSCSTCGRPRAKDGTR